MSARRPHVLLLGMQFPPARGSGVYRIRAWANHLARRGMDVTVLAADRAFWRALAGDVDEDLVRTVDPRVRVVEVNVPREHLIQDVRAMSWLHASFPKAYLTAHEKFREKVFPESYAPMLPTYVRHGVAVHLHKPVDVILSTGNPYTQYAAAHVLSRILPPSVRRRLPRPVDAESVDGGGPLSPGAHGVSVGAQDNRPGEPRGHRQPATRRLVSRPLPGCRRACPAGGERSCRGGGRRPRVHSGGREPAATRSLPRDDPG